MTTTVVKDSIVGDQWLQQVAAACPIQRVINKETGLPTGDILTGPVRLTFPYLDKPPEKKPGATSEPKYGSGIMFTPYADFGILYEEYYKLCGQIFPEYWNPDMNQYYGLQSPFHDQAEKSMKYKGYTPGLVSLNCTSKFKPPVVDNRGNPIVDYSKVYPGVWAICSLKPYDYGKNPPQPKKGVAFGLQSVMLIGDDTNIGTAGPDTKQQFAGINVAAPVTRPNIAGMPQGGPPAPAAGIPGYTSPGGGVQMPYGAPQGVPQGGPVMAPMGVPGAAPFGAPAGVPQPMSPQPGLPGAMTASPSSEEDELRAMGLI